MNRRFRTATAIVLLATASSAWVAFHSPVQAQSSNVELTCGTPVALSTAASTPLAIDQPIDLTVIDSLVQHQVATRLIANLGLQRAQDSDVRRIALRIAESQVGELQLLRTWRSNWYPNAASTYSAESTQSLVAPILAELCTTNDFDRSFLNAMIAHDQTGIALVQAAIPQIEHEELRTSLSTYIENTKSELRSMQQLLDRLPIVS